MRFRIQLSLFLASVVQAYSQDCPYKTIAGLSVTFRGDNGPVANALFNAPSGIGMGSDGSIYLADTGNHRVRRIDPNGVVHPVAGTGEPAFRGDGGPGTTATVHSPRGLAIAPDGTVYIADTGNHRIRKVSPDGVIRTVAGDGNPRFTGDAGPGTTVSLNTPTQLALDDSGTLYILDSGNARIRRLYQDGTIRTVAGASPVLDYQQAFSGTVTEGNPAASAQNLVPSDFFGVMAEGVLYINSGEQIWRVGADGLLRLWLTFDRSAIERKLNGPVPLTQLSINGGRIAVRGDGAVYIDTTVQLILVRDGVAIRVSDPLGFRPSAFFHIIQEIAVDPLNGDALAISKIDLIRQAAGGSRTVVWSAPPAGSAVPAAALDFPIEPTGIAVAPDGTIFVAESTRILTIKSDGQLRLFAGSPTGSTADGTSALNARLSGVGSLAVDSDNTVYFAEPSLNRVRTIGTDGLVRTAFTTPDQPASVRIDGQHRVYVFSGRSQFSELIRYDQNGESTVLMTDTPGGFFWQSVSNASNAPGMAVAKDGTVYLGFTGSFGNTASSVLKIAPGKTSQILPMQERLFPAALAVTEDGTVYVAAPDGRIKQILPDGTMVTVRNRERTGFWGERGLDSEPLDSSRTKDLALDGRGGLLAMDSSVRNVTLSCPAEPGPALTAVVESATSNTSLRLAPGQLFSAYGLRLGPVAPITAGVDNTGHYPTQLDGTQVLIDGIPTPLLFAGENQINAIVPFSIDGHKTVSIEILRNGRRSDILSAYLGRIGPAIISYPGPGLIPDLYVRMVNEDGSINGPDHPAKLGSLVTVFASGLGITTPDGEDGKVADLNLKRPIHPVHLNVEAQWLEILYAGTAPGIVEGVTQINLRLPKELPGRGGCCAFIGLGVDENVPQPNRLLFYFAP